jgi:hypothetical protein
MMNVKSDILRITVLTLSFMLILSLSGCGGNNNLISKDADNLFSEDSKTDVVKTDTAVDTNDAKNNELHPALPEVPVSTQAEDIHYYIEDDIAPARAIHRCRSDGENIYLAYGEPDLYVMSIDSDTHRAVNIDNPDKLDVCNIAMDTTGRIHLLMGSIDDKEWFIWQLDENYKVTKVLDISAYFESKQMPSWFIIDKAGNYYLQWLFDRNGILVDSEGTLKNRFTLNSLDILWSYEASVGKDGLIYIVYTTEEQKFKIGQFDVESCSIKNEVFVPELSDSVTFSEMSAGTDTNLLLFSPVSGVWAYDNESGVIENRVLISDIDFGENTDFWPLTYLADGRLLLVGSTIISSESKSKECVLKYVPVGR